MPIKRIKILLKSAKGRGKRPKKKLDKFVIIFRINEKNHAVYFTWPKTALEKPPKKPLIVSTDPETKIIEIHRASFFPKRKLEKRLKWLDNLRRR